MPVDTPLLSASPLRTAASLLLMAALMMLAAGSAQAQERDPDLVPHPNPAMRNAPTTNAVQTQAASQSEVAQALGLSAGDVVSVDFRSSDPAGFEALSGSAAGFPKQGGDYLALSSGFTSVALDNNTSGQTSGIQQGLVTPGGGNDMVQMEIELNVPDGASSLSFDFKFFSEEFPEFVGSTFNDGFVVEIGTSTFTVNGSTVNAPDNIVFDENDDLITVNTVFGVSENNATGTTYDGATPTLTTTLSGISSSTITLIFSVFDVGDDIYDSTVFLDNLRFGVSATPLELVGLEVNQSIQSWENSVVPLVEDKPTLVRAHIQKQASSDMGSAENIRLKGIRNGSPLPGSPLKANFNNDDYEIPTSEIPIAERRADFSKSLNFLLPNDWLSGTVDLELTGNVDCDEAVATDVDCLLQVPFEAVPQPKITFFLVNWIDNDGELYTPQVDLVEVVNQLDAMYPISGSSVSVGRSIVINKINPFVEGRPSAEDVMNRLESLWEDDLENGLIGEDHVYHGFIDNVANNFDDNDNNNTGGRGNPAPGISFSITDNFSSRNLNPFVVAHELGHVFERPHAVNSENGIETIDLIIEEFATNKLGYCGSSANAGVDDFPYKRLFDGDEVAAVGPSSEGSQTEIWGVNSFDNSIVDPRNRVELMSYCWVNKNILPWISDVTYSEVRNGINERLGSPPAVAPSMIASTSSEPVLNQIEGEEDYLLVRGRIDLKDGSAEFRPFASISTSLERASILTPDPGDFTLEALNGEGSALEEISFELQVGASKRVPTSASFSIPVSADPDIKKVQVRFEGEVIGSLTATENAPTVTVESPNGGETLSGNEVTLEWSGSDSDGDDLVYTIQYSRNGGTTWKTLNTSWPQTTLDVELDALGETDNGLIRVQASDGFNTATDVSDAPFATPNTGPTSFIQSPSNNSTFSRSAPVPLKGKAADLEDGQLTGSSLQWSSSLDGPLGTGEAVDVPGSTLSTGMHNITLTATDAGGLSSVSTVGIEVVKDDSETIVTPPECSELDLEEIGLQISDFDSDQPGSPDTGEFVELTNTASDDLSLSGCALVFFDGATSASYYAANLSGIVEPGDAFLAANAGVEGVQQSFPENTLQNGPDAIALYKGEVASFPDGTPVTIDGRLSAVVYFDDENIFGTFQSTASGSNAATQSAVKSGVAPSSTPLLQLGEIAGSDALQAPDEFALEKNYPNPFRSRTTIRFDLPEASRVDLVIYDVLGREVHRPVAGEQMRAGTHEVVWEGRAADGMPVASGVYIYRLEAGDNVMSQRMVVVR